MSEEKKKRVRKRRGKDEIVRSAIISLGKVNKGKIDFLKSVANDGKEITQKYINIFWNIYVKDSQTTIRRHDINLPSCANSSLYNKLSAAYTARFMQSCATKALSILKPLLEKQNKRSFIYKELVKEYKLYKPENVKKRKEIKLNIKKLKKIFDVINSKPPTIKHFSLDLNGNFVINNFNLNSNTIFNNWISLRCIKKGVKLHLPIIKTKIFNKFVNQNYTLSNFLQITDTGLVKVVFSKKIPKKSTGIISGCDVGAINVWSLDNGEASQNRTCGKKTHELKDILISLKRKIKKSKNKRKRRTMRDQFVNWSINQLNLTNIKILKLENLKNMKYKQHVNQMLTAWKGTYLIHKLEARCEEVGIKVIKVNPRYTSQRCSSCGWVYKKNRNGKNYNCIKCKLEIDADINAAKNILYLNKTDDIKGDNRKGFYFNH